MDDENSKSEMYPTIKEEQCLHCKEFVQVELFPNGDGHAGERGRGIGVGNHGNGHLHGVAWNIEIIRERSVGVHLRKWSSGSELVGWVVVISGVPVF